MADHTLNNTIPFISKVKLPSQSTPGQFDEYEIHDERAIHDIKDLGLSTVLDFQGTTDTAEDIFMLQSAKKGDVYLITTGDEKGTEYVCIETYQKEITGQYPEYWEPLGNVHDAASSTHTHSVNVPQQTVTISNAVVGSDSVEIPVYQGNTVYNVVTATGYNVGTAASFTPSVTNDGVLILDFVANTPTSLTEYAITDVKTLVATGGTTSVVTSLTKNNINITIPAQTVNKTSEPND